MQELGRFFRAYYSKTYTNWANRIKDIQSWINLAINKSSGFVPYELHFGKSIKDKIPELIQFLPVKEILREVELEKAHEEMLKAAKNRAKQQEKVFKIIYKEGDRVLLRIPYQTSAIDKEINKLDHIYIGPYRIYIRIIITMDSN